MAEQAHTPDGARRESGTSRRTSDLGTFLELFALSGIAVSQPILAAFGSNADAFVTARAGWFDIAVFVALIVVGPPLGLWLVEKAVGAVVPRARRWVHRVSVAGLVALMVLRLLRGSPSVAFGLLVLALVGVGTWLAVTRPAPVHQYLRYLAFAPVLFVALFLMSPANGLLLGSDPSPVADRGRDDLPPVVMIVFDELPTESLLDGSGAIDGEAFPAFAELASEATFARNHTAVSPSTPDAVPPILTGEMPTDPADLAIARDHPDSIFTELGSDYDIRAVEHVTEICPSGLCETPEGEGTQRQHPLRALLRSSLGVLKGSSVSFDIGIRGLEPGPRFDWLIDGFDDQGDQPALHYIHTMLPHQDWIRLPDGRLHDAPDAPDGMVDGVMPEDPAAARLAKQRHMLQLTYADRLLGRTLDGLREAGLYDDALVVVTADHGVSFLPDNPARPLSEDNVADVLWVPLLVKAPQQQEPTVVDSPTSSIDVLPTILDVLDLDAEGAVDGMSIFGEPRPADWQVRAFPWEYDELEPADDGYVHVDGEEGFASIIGARGLDAEPGTDLALWRWGRFGDLVGQPVTSFQRASSGEASVTVDDGGKFDSVDLSAEPVPVYVSGRVQGDGPDAVAVAVNGVIGGWYDISETETVDGARTFHVMVPPSFLVDGQNSVEAYLVDTRGDDIVLVSDDSSR